MVDKEEVYNEALRCPTCEGTRHPYREKCHECERMYSRKELSIAIEETWMATLKGGRSLHGISRLVLAKLNDRAER